MNQWFLTPLECASLDAMVEHFCDKRACEALGTTAKALSAVLVRARKKMKASTRLEMFLLWDRFKRSLP